MTSRSTAGPGLRALRRLPPGAWVATSFAVLIAFGTGALLLPPATPPEQPLSFVDALFTATSASCVTGLVVRDTGAGFTPFGQTIVIVLVQLGGLGVMTLWLVLFVRGGRFSVAQRQLVETSLTGGPQPTFRQLLKLVAGFTLMCEALGALLLYTSFLGRLERPLVQAVFHAISAFCNAGFTLLPASLTGFRSDPVVNVTVATLVTLGGLGFVAVLDFARSRGRWRRLALHTKLVIVSSALLVAAGALGFWLLERGGALAGQGPAAAWFASLFHSVSARTAGFNTVEIGDLAPATLLLLALLMFVGASPGSCGGGIKTTTAATLLLTLRAELAGRQHVNAFARTLTARASATAFAIAAVALTAAFAGFFALMLIEAPADERPLDYLFETVSALGTVGLSTGVTAGLAPASKLVVAALMFVGRVGPLTIMALVAGGSARHDWRQPNEAVMLG